MASPGVSLHRTGRLLLCLSLAALANRINDEGGLLEDLHGVSISTSDQWKNVLKKMQEDPISVFRTLEYVVVGTRKSIEYFQKKPPAVEDGMAVIQVNMWAAIETFSDLVDPEFSKTQEFKDARTAWNQGFDDSVPKAQAAADKFEEDGNLTAFGEIIEIAVNTSQNVSTIAFPEMKTTFEAYGNLMRGAADCWTYYFEGQTEKALESVWVAFNSSIATLVGPERAAEPSFQNTMEDLDDVVTALTRNLVTIRQSKIESKICYKKTKVRRSIPPSVCRNNHDWDWDQRKTCFPHVDNGADCGDACVPTGANCRSFCPAHKPWCCKAGDPAGPEECKHAVFVNHSFTKGTAEDYFQCVSPVVESLVQEQAVESDMDTDAPSNLDTADVAQGLIARRAASLAQQAGRQVTKLDSSLGWKCWVMFWRRSCKETEDKVVDDRSRWGTSPAECDLGTGYIHQINTLCYQDCDQGYTVVKDGEKPTPECVQTCQRPRNKEGVIGAFDPFKYEVCSNSTALINECNLDIASATANTVRSVTEAVLSLQQNKSLDTDILVKTINALGSLAKEFARPQCDW